MAWRIHVARLALALLLPCLLVCLTAAGTWAADCPAGFVKTPSGTCIKPSGSQPSGKSSGIPSGMPSGKQGGQPQGQSQGKPQGQPQGKSQGQPQGKSQGCSQAFSNCNAVCAQNYAGHRNPAVYNACLTNCNLGYNTCR